MRKGFTVIELIVVIGVLTILIGLLLPVLTGIRHSAQVAQQKADFQTITAALENYRHDFGDYPRNIILPTWNTGNGTVNTNAPDFLTLCSALLGPGPAVTQPINGTIEQGDGADGAGFRTQCVVTAVTLNGAVSVAAGSVTISGGTPASFNLPPYMWSIDLSVGQPYEEVIGIIVANSTGGPGGTDTLTLSTPTLYTHPAGDACAVKLVTGKVWPNYLDTNAFKTTFTGNFVPTLYANYYGQAELLDRWGGTIEYFPRYGPANDRMQTSTWNSAPQTPKPGQIGPLFGFSAPNTIDAVNGNDAIFDVRDAAPIALRDSNNNITGFQLWQSSTSTVDLYMAVQWMLGCTTPTQLAFSGTGITAGPSYIIAPDNLHFDGPFILISAGVDGPTRANGGFCNLAPVTQDNVHFQQAMQASGNIYNFDR
jgi:prepilin-type N-terminal cleavage/methylation domain-containing protein